MRLRYHTGRAHHARGPKKPPAGIEPATSGFLIEDRRLKTAGLRRRTHEMFVAPRLIRALDGVLALQVDRRCELCRRVDEVESGSGP